MICIAENQSDCKITGEFKMDVIRIGNRMRLISQMFSEVPEIARVACQLFSGQHLQISIRLRPLSWSDWNLHVLVFVEGGKAWNPKKNPQSKARNNKNLNHM